MQGMFRANGGCGYVKKPDFLLETGPDNEVFDPKSKLPVKTTLKVRVLHQSVVLSKCLKFIIRFLYWHNSSFIIPT